MTVDRAHTFKISRDLDSIWCSQETVAFAELLGFDSIGLSEIAISVSELVTNVVKYADEGSLTLSRIDSPRIGIQIIVEDDGPGISDIDSALIDGFSEGHHLVDDEVPIGKRRGLGAGLGAVQRLMSSVSIQNKPEGGTRVVAQKWLPARTGRRRESGRS